MFIHYIVLFSVLTAKSCTTEITGSIVRTLLWVSETLMTVLYYTTLHVLALHVRMCPMFTIRQYHFVFVFRHILRNCLEMQPSLSSGLL